MLNIFNLYELSLTVVMIRCGLFGFSSLEQSQSITSILESSSKSVSGDDDVMIHSITSVPYTLQTAIRTRRRFMMGDTDAHRIVFHLGGLKGASDIIRRSYSVKKLRATGFIHLVYLQNEVCGFRFRIGWFCHPSSSQGVRSCNIILYSCTVQGTAQFR
jgi:hypothetical protein